MCVLMAVRDVMWVTVGVGQQPARLLVCQGVRQGLRWRALRVSLEQQQVGTEGVALVFELIARASTQDPFRAA